MHRPTFTLQLGSLRATSEEPAGGPRALVVDRDMDVPADVLHVELESLSGVELEGEVTLALGYDGENERVFTGVVTEIRGGISGVTVTALGTLGALLELRTATTYKDRLVGAIVGDLIDQAGLEAGTVSSGPTLPRFVVDRRRSAFAHVKGLADRLGYELYADRDGRVMFHALGDDVGLDAGGGLLGAGGGALMAAAGGALMAAAGGAGGEDYAYGKHLLDATAARKRKGPGGVQVGGESPTSSQGSATAHWLTTGDEELRGEAGEGEPVLTVVDAAARTKDLADRFAAGHLARAGRNARQLRVTVGGRPGLELGDAVSVSDRRGTPLSGRGYVRALRHELGGATGFVTRLRVREAGA